MQQQDKQLKEMFKNCAPFTKCISKINNTQVDNAKDLNVTMLPHSLIEYGDNYSKVFGIYDNITEMSRLIPF